MSVGKNTTSKKIEIVIKGPTLYSKQAIKPTTHYPLSTAQHNALYQPSSLRIQHGI
jgi:hypothetical protein